MRGLLPNHQGRCRVHYQGGKKSKYTINVEYTIDVPDYEFDENDDPIDEIDDDFNYFIDAFQIEAYCSSVEKW